MGSVLDFTPGGLYSLTGEVWIAESTSLVSLAPDGSVTRTIDLAGLGLSAPAALAFDPVTQSLWLTSAGALARFDAAGQYQGSLAGVSATGALAVAGFEVSPTPSLALGVVVSGAGLLPGLDEFDVFFEQVVDQIGELDAFLAGFVGEVGLHLGVEVDREIELRAGLVELAAGALAEIVFAFHRLHPCRA